MEQNTQHVQQGQTGRIESGRGTSGNFVRDAVQAGMDLALNFFNL